MKDFKMAEDPDLANMSFELWACGQLLPGEGIVHGAERIESALSQNLTVVKELFNALEKAVGRQGFSNDELISARDLIERSKNLVEGIK